MFPGEGRRTETHLAPRLPALDAAHVRIPACQLETQAALVYFSPRGADPCTRPWICPQSHPWPRPWWRAGSGGGQRLWCSEEDRLRPRVGEQAPIPFPPLFPSSVSEELKGEGRGSRGLPNNVFRVWGQGDPPAVGFDDGAHGGLLGGRAALDILVIFPDAAETGRGDRGLGLGTTGLGGVSGQGPKGGPNSWGFSKPRGCQPGP